MTFLNWAMLAGLAAVAIPIIIHLLNRQRATVVDWGAMRFLMDSMTSRSRRILIEEIILMALRCLAMGLLALALARPFTPSHTSIPWAIVLPAFLFSIMLFGVAGAAWRERKARWILLGVAAGLMLIAVGGSLGEYYMQGKRWSFSGGERDVAIILDGSGSMQIPVDGKPNFTRAVEEARAIVEAMKPADTVSVIVAGSVPRAVLGSPTADRREIAAALDEAAPAGGTMRVVDALAAANASLAQGSNPAKKIVLLTDGQGLGWEVRNEARWQYLETTAQEFTIPPQVVYRALPLPKSLRNAAVGDIRFSRQVIGTDRTVRIDVAVVNSGTVGLPPVAVDLTVDGVDAGHQISSEIKVGASESVRFDHRFEKPGVHLVTAKVAAADEMPSDNTGQRVVQVVDKLPVLVVDGDPSVRALDGAASFIEIALTPAEADDGAGNTGGQAASGTRGPAASGTRGPAASGTLKAGSSSVADRFGHLVKLTSVAGPDIASIPDFHAYSLVILANVPRLPAATAAGLRRYVLDGGGLLVVTGDKVQPAFYDNWVSDVGEPVMPAPLGLRKVLGEKPARLGLKSFSHPALDLLTDTTQSDAEQVAVSAYWAIPVNVRDKNVRIGGFLDTGDPVLVERRLGKGCVMMTAFSLDRRDSNLPARKCYVPLVHELAYYLAAPTVVEANVRPGSEFAVELPLKTLDYAKLDPKKGSGASKLLAGLVDVVAPGDRHAPAVITDTPRGVRLSFLGTYEPGLYYVVLPPKAAESFVIPAGLPQGLPFVVFDDANEGNLVPLAAADLAAVGKRLSFYNATDTEKLVTAVTEPVPGEELWKYLALALLGALLAETALARWIAGQRRLTQSETVTFGSPILDTRSFREKARQMLAVPKQEPESASKP
jgi:hypothetical protein